MTSAIDLCACVFFRFGLVWVPKGEHLLGERLFTKWAGGSNYLAKLDGLIGWCGLPTGSSKACNVNLHAYVARPNN